MAEDAFITLGNFGNDGFVFRFMNLLSVSAAFSDAADPPPDIVVKEDGGTEVEAWLGEIFPMSGSSV